MDCRAEFLRWKRFAVDDSDIQHELSQLNTDIDAGLISDRFYRELEFGTGGLRGVIGAGTNRMNIYTVRKATQGLCNYLKKSDLPLSVAIAYDSRIKSQLFARNAACVLSGNGINAWIYPRLQPTPALSWAVRELHCGAGICITASHNPAKYNGYKVYGRDGCQITLEAAAAIQKEICSVDIFNGIVSCTWDDGLVSGKIRMIPEECLDHFLDAVQEQSFSRRKKLGVKVVYTPLNGTGLECVTRILERIGVTDITIVPEQEKPDGNFPTCPYPNPEIQDAMALGLELCKKLQADLLIGTDPDCDRMGAAVRDGAGYTLISGNEMGTLLFDYICRRRLEIGTMPEHPVAVTTIVSTDMADAVAKKYGVELRKVLTGFKFIGEQICLLEKQGQADRFIFGFEESYGYLTGCYVRDKDAVNASMLCCEMAAWYRQKGSSLLDVLRELYAEFGCYHNQLASFEFDGESGAKKMRDFMANLRTAPFSQLCGQAVIGVVDYLCGQGTKLNLPRSDVIEFRLECSKVLIRPSGTEPKIKIYLSSKSDTLEKAAQNNQRLLDAVLQR